MNDRFFVIDEFGGKLRGFDDRKKAQTFIRNKPGCTIHEHELIDILGECLL